MFVAAIAARNTVIGIHLIAKRARKSILRATPPRENEKAAVSDGLLRRVRTNYASAG
jgi:hypothetical protein